MERWAWSRRCASLPLLEGTDGVQKMSEELRQLHRLTDELADNVRQGRCPSPTSSWVFYRLASTVPVDEIDGIERGLAADESHPNKVKRALARNIVGVHYDDGAAQAAEEQFDLVFKQHAVPDDIPEFKADLTPNEVLPVAKLLGGLAWPEARRRGAPHR